MVRVYLCHFVSWAEVSFRALLLPTVITLPLPVYIPSSFLIKAGGRTYLCLGHGLGYVYNEGILSKGLYIINIIITIIIIIILIII